MIGSESKRLRQQLAFINELEKLKLVYRRNMTIDRSRAENSAEHSWHGAMMALVLAEHAAAAELDRYKVIKLLLVHDLVEIYAGDTWLYDSAGAEVQAANEAAAAQRLFGLLPPDQGAEFLALWEEFEARSTPEAAFAAAIDGLQPLLNHLASGEPEAGEEVIASSAVIARKRSIAASSPALWAVAQEVIAVSVERGLYGAEPDAG